MTPFEPPIAPLPPRDPRPVGHFFNGIFFLENAIKGAQISTVRVHVCAACCVAICVACVCLAESAHAYVS